MTIPYAFANQSGPIPLNELDANFNALDGFTFDFTGIVDKAALGGSTDAWALFAVTSLTSRDGWSQGFANCIQLNRTADTATSLTNPLNHTIRVNTQIQSASNVQVREWAITAIAEDFSNSTSVTVGVTGIGRRHYGTSRTWGGVMQGLDYLDNTTLSTATANTYGIEVDIAGNGDDSFGRRTGLYIVSQNQSAGAYVGPVGTNRNYYGAQIFAQGADLWNGLYIHDTGTASINEALVINTVGLHAIHVAAGASYTGSAVQVDAINCVNGFAVSASVGATGAVFVNFGTGEYGFLNGSGSTITEAAFQDSCTTANEGFYAAGTYAVAAFRMIENQLFRLGSAGGSGITMRYNSSNDHIEFLKGAVVKQFLVMT